MDNEIVEKIFQNVRASPLNEAAVQHLFALARKLIERVSEADRNEYAILKFYCDWTLHSEIDRSEAGALILARLHEIISDHLQKKDNSTLVSELTAALSLDRLRDQLNKLLLRYGGPREVIDKAKWREIVLLLTEIISHCPLTIGPKVSKLKVILQAIKSQPLKGSSVTESLTVIKVPASTFYPEEPKDRIMYCLMLTISDTTKIIAPLVSP